MCFFSQCPCLKEPKKQDEIKGVSEVCGRVCAQFILEFSHSPVFMDRTDTVYLYVCIQYFVGAWLALRMPPPSLFSKPSGAESQVFKTQCLDAGIIHIKLAGSNKSSGQAGLQNTGA